MPLADSPLWIACPGPIRRQAVCVVGAGQSCGMVPQGSASPPPQRRRARPHSPVLGRATGPTPGWCLRRWVRVWFVLNGSRERLAGIVSRRQTITVTDDSDSATSSHPLLLPALQGSIWPVLVAMWRPRRRPADGRPAAAKASARRARHLCGSAGQKAAQVPGPEPSGPGLLLGPAGSPCADLGGPQRRRP